MVQAGTLLVKLFDQDLQAQLKEAQAAGDTKRAERIKQRGQALQTLRHLQVFSNAPVDDLLVLIQDQLPQVARTAGADIITSRLDFQTAGVETIDVTDALVHGFSPDERTLKSIEQLRGQRPIDLIDALMIKD